MKNSYDFVLNFFTIDMVAVMFLGVVMFFVQPDLQGQIVSGLIGFIGKATIERMKKAGEAQ